MVDRLHQRGVGVILDWVPSHFPTDAHGLARFDGTHLYEHADPRQGYHPDWTSAIFNYGRREVRSFLISSALCWLDRYHADGLRVDAVASMLYLDYSRKRGRVDPQPLRRAGEPRGDRLPPAAQRRHRRGVPRRRDDRRGVDGVADGHRRHVADGGLGFGFKWDMGWMHDTLQYVRREPVHRRFHHDEITFRSVYAFTERYVLPLSHDEVVHGKGSLLGKMPGDEWQRFANLRLLYGMMWAQPGKKLLFMGGELATYRGVEPRGDARLEPPRRPRPRRRRGCGSPRSTTSYRTEPALCARRHRPGRVPVDHRRRRHAQRVRLAAHRPDRRGAAGDGRGQRHAGRPLRLPRRRARGRHVGRSCSTPTPRSTAAAARATSAASRPRTSAWHGFAHSLP